LGDPYQQLKKENPDSYKKKYGRGLPPVKLEWLSEFKYHCQRNNKIKKTLIECPFYPDNYYDLP
jgi:hypothetical protein